VSELDRLEAAVRRLLSRESRPLMLPRAALDDCRVRRCRDCRPVSTECTVREPCASLIEPHRSKWIPQCPPTGMPRHTGGAWSHRDHELRSLPIQATYGRHRTSAAPWGRRAPNSASLKTTSANPRGARRSAVLFREHLLVVPAIG
jgi:hypothetical protein